MSDKPVTIVVSDLHMGGGPDDPGDDFVHQHHDFDRLLQTLLESEDGQAGRIELMLNGDTFELAQVRPELYTLGSSTYWCSERESVAKLRHVLDGHKAIFSLLGQLIAAGNTVTLAAGNHDVELYWDAVQDLLANTIGRVGFELKQEWYTRYDGALAIAHGHMLDRANRFEHWDDPRLEYSADERRLEMCPGTLFMAKFVNPIEKEYPFADNLHPVTALAHVLIKDSAAKSAAAAWLLSRFAVRHPRTLLSSESPVEYEAQLRRIVLQDATRFRTVADAYREAVDASITDEAMRTWLATPNGIVDCYLALLGALPRERWDALAYVPRATLSSDSRGGHTLAIIGSQGADGAEVLRQAASERFEAGASVVVMGHTHHPDTLHAGDAVYYNPGSWTRYLGAASIGLLTLDDLKSERNFPYQLNYVRVEPQADGRLSSQMITFEAQVGVRFGQRLNIG